MPVALAPTGLTGMQHADGEMLAAQAAEDFGVPFTLSTMSICSIEDVASVTKSPSGSSSMSCATRFRPQPDRAGEGGEMLGAGPDPRPADHRPAPQGFPQRAVGATEMAAEARLADRDPPVLGEEMLGPRRSFGNIVGPPRGSTTSPRLPAWANDQYDPRLSWKDVAWIKEAGAAS